MRRNSLITIGIVLILIGVFARIGAFMVMPFPILILIIVLVVRAVKKSQYGQNTEQNNTEERTEEFRAEESRTEEPRTGESYYTGTVITCDYCGSSVDTSKYYCCNHCGAPYGEDIEWKEIHYKRNR